MNFIPFIDKEYESAAFDEPLGIAYREDVPALQTGENAFRSLAFGSADEKDLAVLDVLDAVIALNGQRVAVHFFVPYGFVQEAVKGVVTQNADTKGLIGTGGRVGWPFDELGEVKQEDGLNLVFPGNRRFRPERP